VAGGAGGSTAARAELLTAGQARPDIDPNAAAAPGAGTLALSVDNLSVELSTPAGPIRPVRGVSFSVPRGRALGIIGESGSGKSVTARSVLGLLPRHQATVGGSIMVAGHEIVGQPESVVRRYRGAQVAIVLQDPAQALNPTQRIGDQVSEALRLQAGLGRDQAKARALELLDAVGIPSARQRYRAFPHQLSGGMKQRVMLAAAISCNPAVLIADEPTTALDVTTQLQIMELIRSLQRDLDMALVLITHDLHLAGAYVDEVAVMYAGRIVEHGSVAEVTGSPRMPYTHGLLNAAPQASARPHSRLAVMPGRPPDPREQLTGCPFAPRCGRAAERCTAEEPVPQQEAGHSWSCWFPYEG
jgi:oligopeptide/dipeptide ABC transporter ATP-binding protein